MPREPPTWRMLLITAEPTPAFATGTEPIAAAVVGVITSAMPKPPTSRPGRMFQKVDPASRVEKIRSDAVRSTMPRPISHREPTLSERRPACGATRMIRHVIGRNVAPGRMGGEWREFWVKRGVKKKNPKNPGPTGGNTPVRTGERGLAEEREVEHRDPLMQLE